MKDWTPQAKKKTMDWASQAKKITMGLASQAKTKTSDFFWPKQKL